jgi:hypothetical protein
MKKCLALLLVAIGCLFLANCKTVDYTERAFLAEYVMLPNKDHLTKAMTDHMYFSREAAFGGEGVGGGGCGCN